MAWPHPALAHGQIVADLSVTAISEGGPEPTAFISLSKAARADASIESLVAAMGSLAVAIGRAGSRREAAELANLVATGASATISWLSSGRPRFLRSVRPSNKPARSSPWKLSAA